MRDQLCPKGWEEVGPGVPARCAHRPCVMMTQEQLEQISAHARRSYPLECCGILIGVPGDPVRVCAARPAENLDRTRGRDRYRVDPREILRAERVAEACGQEVVGFYHSHPDHPARPSATDTEYAWPGYVYLIVAVSAAAQVELRAWSFDEGRRGFRERPICAAQPVAACDGPPIR